MRTRGGCLAHARRKIFEQREHPWTKEALDLISEIYLVEHEAEETGIAVSMSPRRAFPAKLTLEAAGELRRLC